MKSPTQIHTKRLKRKRKVAGKIMHDTQVRDTFMRKHKKRVLDNHIKRSIISMAKDKQQKKSVVESIKGIFKK